MDSLQHKRNEQLTTQTKLEDLWVMLSEIDIPSDASLAEIRKLNTPPLSALVKKQDGLSKSDKSECYKFLELSIIGLNEYFGVTWSDGQVSESSKEFYSAFFYWTIADIKNFLKRCKRSVYGIPFGSAYSPAVFIKWATDYDKEWSEASQRIAEGSHNTITREEKLCSKDDRMKAIDDAKAMHQIDLERFRNENKTNP